MKRSLRTQAIDFAAHMRRRWYLYLPVFAIWAFAYTRLFIDPTPRVPVLFNWTGSLPYRVAWLQHGEHPLQRAAAAPTRKLNSSVRALLRQLARSRASLYEFVSTE